jgi:hypothetical protein
VTRERGSYSPTIHTPLLRIERGDSLMPAKKKAAKKKAPAKKKAAKKKARR